MIHRVAVSLMGGAIVSLGTMGCFEDALPAMGEESTTTAMATETTAEASTVMVDDTAAEASTAEDPSTTGGPGETTEGTTTEGTGTTEGATEGTSEGSTGPVVECGNGEAEPGEDCDGIDWQGATCESLGYLPGSLACSAGCAYDVSGCVPPETVLVLGGPFEMGSLALPDEQPVRIVEVDAFYIDELEVTTADYTACVNAGACMAPTTGGQCNYAVVGREDHPINCVGWLGASDYCAWVDGGVKRLPTEAEWEKAARGTDARVYPWGDMPAPSCTYVVMNDGILGCGMGSTWAVGSKPLGVSAHGAMDMGGNVWEWVSDWYGAYDPGELDNPTGPGAGIDRILRGGGWAHSTAESFGTTHRHEIDPTTADPFIGFRCAQTPPGAL